jgi:hypothetical protein
MREWFCLVVGAADGGVGTVEVAAGSGAEAVLSMMTVRVVVDVRPAWSVAKTID